MELVLTSLDIEPLPEHRKEINSNMPKGLLNSNYQNVVRCNFEKHNPRSVFSIKQRIKNRRYQSTNGIETVIKLSVFLLVFLIAFA